MQTSIGTKNFYLLFSIFSCIFLFNSQSFSLRFQTTNENAGRARLVLFQGKTRHEVIGRSCPGGIAFAKPELFSCACVTGVWAFYDIMCAAPLQIVGGVNHCFELPLDTYIQQAILVSNPTRAHGEVLTFFDGDLESVNTKFFRETHTFVNATPNIMTIGTIWTLTTPDGRRQICLDSSKHPVFEDEFSTSTSAYCSFKSVNAYIRNIGAVTPGCKGNLKKLEPETCYPFLESNSEQVCTDISLLEAYEMAVEEEGNDLSSPTDTKPREFKKLIKESKRTTTTTTTTTSTTTTPTTTSTTTPATTSTTKGTSMTSAPEIPFHNYWNASPITYDSEQVQLSRSLPLLQQDLQASLMNIKSSLNKQLGLLEGDDQIRRHRNPQEEGDTSKLTKDQMQKIYLETVQNQDSFLTLNTPTSKQNILEIIWAYQRNEIKKALDLSMNSTVDPDQYQVELLLNAALMVLYQKCPSIPMGFLTLCVEAFVRMQREWYRPNFRLIRGKYLDDILASLRNCAIKSPPYDFVKPSSSACVAKNPDSIHYGNGTKKVEIPEMYDSAGFEPIIETVWKIAIHSLILCNAELSQNIRYLSELTIIFTEIFSNPINLLWKRGYTVENEYGGVIGDIKTIMKNIDVCVSTAILYIQSPLNYTRPDFKPEPGWVPENSDEEEFTTPSNDNNPRPGRHIKRFGSLNAPLPFLSNSLDDHVLEKSTIQAVTSAPKNRQIPATPMLLQGQASTTPTSTESKGSKSESGSDETSDGNRESESESEEKEEPSVTPQSKIFEEYLTDNPNAPKQFPTSEVPGVANQPKDPPKIITTPTTVSTTTTTTSTTTTTTSTTTTTKPTTSPAFEFTTPTEETLHSTPSSTTPAPLALIIPDSSTLIPITTNYLPAPAPTQLSTQVDSTTSESLTTTPLTLIPTPSVTEQNHLEPTTLEPPKTKPNLVSESGSESEYSESDEEDSTQSPAKSRDANSTVAPAESRSRKRRAVEMATPEQWKNQRKVLGMAYCLKKFDELRIHLGQDCD